MATLFPQARAINAVGAASDYVVTTDAQYTLRLDTNSLVWDDLRVPGTSMRSGPTAPTFAAFIGGVYLNFFADTATIDETHFTIQMPHSWKLGTNIYPHVHWSHNIAVPETTKGVVWALEYTWQNIGSNFGGTTTMNAIETWTTPAPPQYKHILTQFKDGSTNPYIVGAGMGLSSMLCCKLSRNNAHASDDFAHPVALLQVDFHYQIDTIGSRQESTK